MIYITILNYLTNSTHIHSIKGIEEDDINDYETYIKDVLKYNPKYISYMVSDSLNLEIK